MGRMGGTTQYTVNNQMVNATLMNIADNPTNVQLPGTYNNEEIPRVPIICTGNDFSTLYAPLIRDGRMEKFYWNPTRGTASESAPESSRMTTLERSPSRGSWTPSPTSPSTSSEPSGPGSTTTSSGDSLATPASRT